MRVNTGVTNEPPMGAQSNNALYKFPIGISTPTILAEPVMRTDQLRASTGAVRQCGGVDLQGTGSWGRQGVLRFSHERSYSDTVA